MIGPNIFSLKFTDTDLNNNEEARAWLNNITFTLNHSMSVDQDIDLIEIMENMGYDKGDVLDFILIQAVEKSSDPIEIKSLVRKNMYTLSVFKSELDAYLNWDRFLPRQSPFRITKKAQELLENNDITLEDLPDPPAAGNRYTLSETKKMVREIRKLKDRPITKKEAYALLLYAEIFGITPSNIKRKYNVKNIVDIKYSTLIRAYRWITKGLTAKKTSLP